VKSWKNNMPETLAILFFVFILVVIVFFWGIVKTTKTQNKMYLWALLPFILFCIGIFFI